MGENLTFNLPYDKQVLGKAKGYASALLPIYANYNFGPLSRTANVIQNAPYGSPAYFKALRDWSNAAPEFKRNVLERRGAGHLLNKQNINFFRQEALNNPRFRNWLQTGPSVYAKNRGILNRPYGTYGGMPNYVWRNRLGSANRQSQRLQRNWQVSNRLSRQPKTRNFMTMLEDLFRGKDYSWQQLLGRTRQYSPRIGNLIRQTMG